jgi:transcription elongation factor Elf1
MSEIDRPIAVDRQQCPSCESADEMRTSIEEGKAWLVCGRCDLRWSVAERRSATASDYRGFERRRPVNG